MVDDKTIAAPHLNADLNVADLDSASWERADPVKIVRYWSGEFAPRSRHCEARILWSDNALHLRFVGDQAEPLIVNLNPQGERKTMGLWDRDVCEIFIAPDSNDVERYFEFEAAPTGEWMEVGIQWRAETRESDWNFSSNMTTATRVETERVTIAMRIPWGHEIHQPQKDERWRINLFRCVGKDPDRGYLAWRATNTPKPNFHVPQVFGWLVFV
ncbi:MAG: carbohydrate-binding family 9-like protein [Pyrinomonadaceae bacterium]